MEHTELSLSTHVIVITKSELSELLSARLRSALPKEVSFAVVYELQHVLQLIRPSMQQLILAHQISDELFATIGMAVEDTGSQSTLRLASDPVRIAERLFTERAAAS